jgi:hypothetical protein
MDLQKILPKFSSLLQRNHNNSLNMDNFKNIILTTDVGHKRIRKMSSQKKKKFY